MFLYYLKQWFAQNNISHVLRGNIKEKQLLSLFIFNEKDTLPGSMIEGNPKMHLYSWNCKKVKVWLRNFIKAILFSILRCDRFNTCSTKMFTHIIIYQIVTPESNKKPVLSFLNEPFVFDTVMLYSKTRISQTLDFLPTTFRVWGNIMFSSVCVTLSIGGGVGR